MKMKCLALVIALVVVHSIAFGQPSGRKNYFEVGVGLLFSSDYEDALVDAYANTYEFTGAFGWIDVEAGYGIALSERVYVIPKLRLLSSRIDIKGYSNLPASQYANTVFLPGVSTRYLLEVSSHQFYGEIFLGPAYPNSDLSRLEFKSDGMAIGAEAGIILGRRVEFGAGFSRVPVKVLVDGFETSAADFGGFGLVARFRM